MILKEKSYAPSLTELRLFGEDCDSVDTEEVCNERGDVCLAVTRVTWRDGSVAMFTPARMQQLIDAQRPLFAKAAA
ncbi:MAG: hypothetical protein MUF16_27055 [Burkholderiaceae bacterium]|nr:hypothetical protein [Burkholderiaceae bacterium]